MPAAYDYYDYPSYWEGRDYEHESEIFAIRSFVEKIPKIDNILEIGCGFGRLSKAYLYRSKKAILSDPSAKLLSIARNSIHTSNDKKVRFLHSNINNIKNRIKKGSQDVVIMVRVLHHLKDVDLAFSTINRLLNDKGYFILEFANKRHFKATVSEFFKGNFTFPLDIFPKDIRSKKNIKKNTLPFLNYHPDTITKKLKNQGFEIIETRSVSNFRNSFIKNYFPLEALLNFEGLLQRTLSKMGFGPSIFVLCRKV
jgi:ubiquinone/menaquinone biosynthesis C-methylase UbiE